MTLGSQISKEQVLLVQVVILDKVQGSLQGQLHTNDVAVEGGGGGSGIYRVSC